MNEYISGKKNRLADSQSPYLLQHALNPVDWYPWSEEAFKKAEEEDKPVFLSIGYSTCHWCHVMERESFEDDEVAKLMNDTFISIKVDREERPDIDSIYMTVCQMITGSGGWPMTIIMTPDKKPFFAGTYFPRDNRYGRLGMIELIPKIKEIWQNKRNDVLKSADEISGVLNSSAGISNGEMLDKKIFDKAFDEFLARYDEINGGFSTAPKFPTPHNFLFLLRYWKGTGNNKALEMVEKTLIEMRKGGIYDHIGFGFCRYSTDRQWLVPHFEKMLYDQAQLAIAYTELFQVTGNEHYGKTVFEILEYVSRNMTSPEGGFYSAEDADSEGVEGKFYLWTDKEIQQVLDKEEYELAVKVFNIGKTGNPAGGTGFHEAHGGKSDSNILHMTKSVQKIAEDIKINEDELNNRIEKIREKLFKIREKRIHPFKDDKILTDWNGLMISAYSKSAQVFSHPPFTQAAEKAAILILNRVKDDNGRLLHRYRNGTAGINANIDDYAFLIAGLIDLYETTFNPYYLEEALSLNEDMIEHFGDKDNGAFFFTANDSEKLLTRQKEIYDGAIPSGNSAAMLNLLRLGKITGKTEYENKAFQIVKTFSNIINKSPSAFTQFLVAMDFLIGPSSEIVLSQEEHSPMTETMLKVIRENFIPNKIVLLVSSREKDKINQIAPFTKDYTGLNGKPTVYVCRNYVCNLPVTEVERLREMLE
jgi:uncharacterized protein YyaL (SSP411 family)